MCKDPFRLFFKCRGTHCEIVLHTKVNACLCEIVLHMKVNASLCAKDFHNISHLHNKKVKFYFNIFLALKNISEYPMAKSQNTFQITEGISFFLSLCLSLFYVSSSVEQLPSLARIKPKPDLVF